MVIFFSAVGSGIKSATLGIGRGLKDLGKAYLWYTLIMGAIFLVLLLAYVIIVALGKYLGIGFSCEGLRCVSEWERVVGIDFVSLLDRIMAGILFFIVAPVGIFAYILSVIINPIGELSFVFINIIIDLLNGLGQAVFGASRPVCTSYGAFQRCTTTWFGFFDFTNIIWTTIKTERWIPDFVLLVDALKSAILVPVQEALV